MNIKIHRNNFLRRAGIFAALLAGIFLVPTLRAQSTEPAVRGRFLFIFDTSSAMKNRVEGVQKAVNVMLATSLNGQMHAGDSMGVWTFNQNLRAGDYPLQYWNPEQAVVMASNLVEFVGEQHYAKSTRFEVLQPLLNQVVQGSERLTILIFCDGETKASGTPFDAGINQFFQQKLSGQKNAHQPFVIVLRSQLGKYANCAMGLPPQPVTFPDFPPLPAPPSPPAPKLTNAPPKAVTNVVPSLIIIGTKIQSSPMPPVPTNLPPATNSSVKIQTAPSSAASPIVLLVPTNASVVSVTPTNQTTTKIISSVAPDSPAAPPSNPGFSNNEKFLFIGAGLFGTVIVLGMIVRLRWHRKDASLITRSMTDRR